jgi:hypothetical protein
MFHRAKFDGSPANSQAFSGRYDRFAPKNDDGTTIHPEEHLSVESRKEPPMIPPYDAYLFDPSAILFDPETPPLPGWFTLGWAALASLVAALPLILG